MQKKSAFVNIATLIILAIGAYGGMFTGTAQAWFGITAMVLTMVLSTFFPSGKLVSGWAAGLWVVNIAGVGIQALTAIADKALLPADLVNQIIIGINLIIQVYFKEFAPENK